MDKILKSIDIGILKVEDVSLDCAVLEDGTRVITTGSILKAFGRTQRGWYKGREGKLLNFLEEKHPESGLQQLPIFMDSKALISVIDEKAIKLLMPIKYLEEGVEKEGFSALILPKICDLYLKARRENILNIQQKHLAAKSEILLSALSQVGIIALVDEATGYQYDRERFELQKILNTYISEEIIKWQLTFTDEFYKEIYRLWDLPFIPKYIKKKPSFIGTLTTKYIYEELPSGIIDKIKQKTGKTKKGNWKYKWHQSLTPEVGREHLKKQIIEVTLLMSISKTKEQFQKLFEKKYNKTVQLQFEFDENPT